MSSTGPGRRVCRQARIGHVLMGGTAPVVVQSMTNTDTADAAATALQVFDLWQAGSEVVRITVNSPEAAARTVARRFSPPMSMIEGSRPAERKALISSFISLPVLPLRAI